MQLWHLVFTSEHVAQGLTQVALVSQLLLDSNLLIMQESQVVTSLWHVKQGDVQLVPP